jgi:hypothetical protein
VRIYVWIFSTLSAIGALTALFRMGIEGAPWPVIIKYSRAEYVFKVVYGIGFAIWGYWLLFRR